MTVHGSAPSYAPISPILDSNGALQPHIGVEIAIAYHFNDPSSPPFLGPGPIEKWASQAHASFAAVPEPSSIALAILMVVVCGVLGRRRGST